MKHTPKNRKQIEAQLKRAMRIEKRIGHVGVRNIFSNHPEIVRSYWEAYGQSAAVAKIALTPRQKSEWNEVVVWLSWLTREEQEIVRAISHTFSQRRVGELVGISHKTCKRMFDDAILVIMLINNGSMKPPRKPMVEQKSALQQSNDQNLYLQDITLTIDKINQGKKIRQKRAEKAKIETKQTEDIHA